MSAHTVFEHIGKGYKLTFYGSIQSVRFPFCLTTNMQVHISDALPLKMTKIVPYLSGHVNNCSLFICT